MSIRIKGGRDCRECGGGDCVELIATSKGLFSRCRCCGFIEWEWAWGDSRDYLDYLAERFGTDVDEIVKALEWVRSGW